MFKKTGRETRKPEICCFFFNCFFFGGSFNGYRVLLYRVSPVGRGAVEGPPAPVSADAARPPHAPKRRLAHFIHSFTPSLLKSIHRRLCARRERLCVSSSSFFLFFSFFCWFWVPLGRLRSRNEPSSSHW